MSTRRISSVAHVGNIAIGGANPIRIQSMATVDTNDTEGCVAQAKRIIDAGGELVRFTTQGTREAKNMANISQLLKADGYTQPLVADVHFNANVADVAAQLCEKVRINPGNYVDPARTFKHLEYTDEEYADELKRLDERLVSFINICKEHHTAVRVGVNGAQNAAILAVEMLALADDELAARLQAYKDGLKEKIEKANKELAEVKYAYKTN